MKERPFNIAKIFYSNVLENQRKVDQSCFKALDCSMPFPYDGLTTEFLAHLASLVSSGLSCPLSSPANHWVMGFSDFFLCF